MIRRAFRMGPALAIAALLLHGQAAVEYAAKSALAESGGGMRVGSCVVGNTLFQCVQRSYPEAFYIGIASLVLVIGWLFSRRRGV